MSVLKLIRRGTAVARVSAGTTQWVTFGDNRLGLELSAGTYLVTICTQDAELENVYTWDNVNVFSDALTMQPGVARVVTMKRDGLLRIRNVTSERGGLVVVKTEPIPPPCVNAFWRVWGWRCGVKEDHDHHQRLRPRLVRHPLRRVSGAATTQLQRWGLHPAGRVHARCGLHIPAGLRGREPANFGVSHSSLRQYLGYVHLPSRLNQRGGGCKWR